MICLNLSLTIKAYGNIASIKDVDVASIKGVEGGAASVKVGEIASLIVS